MGNNKRGVQERVDPEFKEWANDISIERIKNSLEKDKISVREVTRMMMNAENLLNLEKELLTKLRKKDV